MQIREFRQDEFINREKEISFLKDWVNNIPKEILWLYGPKSTGKTTLIEYVIEKELTSNLKIFDKFWIKYINFRGKLVGSYETFLKSFIKREHGSKDEFSVRFNLGVISLNYKVYEKIQNKDIDLFDALIEEFSKIKKTKILIIDEIQTLDSVYYHEEKELLKEFLNFCVRLTKETHLCHVIILSSNTIFIDRIYNDAKLKVTSEFYKIDHLDCKTVKEWLLSKELGFSAKDLELVWNYLGGCIPLIQRMFRKRVCFNNLKEYLESEAILVKNEVADLTSKYFDDEEYNLFLTITTNIISNGYILPDRIDKETIKIVEFMAEKEIFFYDPLTRKVTGNNRLYDKGLEKLIGGR